jgi:maltose O-acetyltransferase
MQSEKERMLAGVLYRASDSELAAARARAHHLLRRYNRTDEHEREARAALLETLFGERPAGLVIEPPFFCDYGTHIAFGADVYLNAGCVILDCARVSIAAGCMFGPNVQVLTATHPLDPEERMRGLELAHPITIGERCWLGGRRDRVPRCDDRGGQHHRRRQRCHARRAGARARGRKPLPGAARARLIRGAGAFPAPGQSASLCFPPFPFPLP